ncbi:MAG: phenylalanine--tRNA ligase subunit beta [Alphaproteobacteria bacterium]|nr:phenylalanine--tRNA ligase subunit beta [Alphaproteobacteria bacterium]
MKFTLSWLKEHLDTNADLDTIVKTLTKIGLEVEEVINPAENLKGFITAKAENVTMHPDSDHLHLLSVNTGKEHLQVVCGAPNVKEGMIGIFAPVGTLIPCYNEVLKVGKIRGVESYGMMCSEKELGIGQDHSGIIELDANTPIGVEAATILDMDPVIEVSITPNRAECLGVRGIARDLAAAGLGSLKPLNIRQTPATIKSPISINVECAADCPVYVGRYIQGVNNKAQSPKWLKDRLTAIGLRSISPLVDITNYINYDLARPLHVFDADKLCGNITVRMAKENEKFVSLEEKEYALDTKALGICDDEGIQCLGGIMGGLTKGCSEDTTNVLLECALFKPSTIARTGRKYGIESDSRYRYERWVDPNSNVLGSDYATQLIVDICGGQASEKMVCGDENIQTSTAYIRPSRLKDFIGMEVSQEKILQILNNLGFETAVEGDKIKATSPSWRGDIEGEHDLVEEVVRMIGLDEIKPISLPTDNLPKQVLTQAQTNVVTIKHELASRGMYETVTWSFTSSKLAKDFMKQNQQDALLLQNPIASDLDQMRPSLLPNLLMGAKSNIAKGYFNISLFEVGPEFYGRNPKEQQTVACGIRVGQTSKKDWANTWRDFDIFDVKADATAVIAAAKGPFENAQICRDAPSYYHPGRSGSLRLGKNILAYFGELHPNVSKQFGIKSRVMAFEVYVDNIPLPRSSTDKAKKKLELFNFQPLDKDLAFVVDKSVDASSILAAAKNADRNYITDAAIFDIYEGENLPENKKSVALRVTFQPKEQTFTDKDIENLMNKVIVEVGKKTGGELRN